MDKLKNVLIEVIQTLEKKQNGIAKSVKNITTVLTKSIEDLHYRCSAMEAIQVRLFSVLAETNPSIHAKIVKEINNSLTDIKKKGGNDSAFADHLRSLLEAKSGKKVHLWLLPKKVSPEPKKPTPPKE